MMKKAPQVYTVSQVNSYLSRAFREDPFLSRIYVRGEVSNCKYHGSGHIYFSLKDESAQVSCVMFASYRRNLHFRLEDGQKVIAFGSMGVYEKGGSYQLYATAMRPDGVGILYERFDALKRELQEMGMFDPMYKKPIPHYIRRLGVVTAPAGAAVRDIINVSKRRNPGIEIILYPALVQGDGAAESIVRGIRLLDRAGVDIIIAGRGGGSIEDLWAFNERIVADAIFEARTPVISAVGHETDFTIADYVADMRAPTPSAAAELAVDDMTAVYASLLDRRSRLFGQMKQKCSYAEKRLEGYSFRLKGSSPSARLRERTMQLDHLHEKMQSLMRRRTESAREDLERYAASLQMDRKVRDAQARCEADRGRLSSLMKEKLREQQSRFRILEARLRARSPQDHLDHGYAYVTDGQGKPLTHIRLVSPGDLIRVTMKDGRLEAEVKKTAENGDM